MMNGRWTALLTGAAIALGALPAMASPFENMVEICGNPDRQPAEALKFCYRALEERALDEQPRSVRAGILMNAGIAAYNLGRWSEAADNQTRALELSPSRPEPYVFRAQAYEKAGRLRDAMADYDKALSLGTRDANAFLGRGVLLLRQGAAEQALADFDQAHRLEPEWSAPLYNRGAVLLRLARFQEAERDFSGVIERNPDDAEAWVKRGEARASQGRRDALGDFDRALELRPEWGAAWFARGLFLEAAGQDEAARADYLRAYELGHDDARLIERINRIGGG